MMSVEFWEYLDRLVASSPRIIDRPRGSIHPRYPELVYPLDYGYLGGTTSMDAGGVDLFQGTTSGNRLESLVLTVDLHKRDAEIKLLLDCTPEEEAIALDFLNGALMRGMLVRRQGELDWIQSRRSVRRFLPKPVPRPLIERIIETAAWSPSAHNRQPWRFGILLEPDAKKRLAHEMGIDFRRDLLADGLSLEDTEAQVKRSSERISGAPAVVVLCRDERVGDSYPDPERRQAEALMGVQSVALAGGTLLLAAHAAGLGGVWMCAPLFAPQAVRRALPLPDAWLPEALILLGYAAQTPKARPRRLLKEYTHFW